MLPPLLYLVQPIFKHTQLLTFRRSAFGLMHMPMQPRMLGQSVLHSAPPWYCRTLLFLLVITAGILQRLPQQASALFGLQKCCTGCCHAFLLGCQRRIFQGCTCNITNGVDNPSRSSNSGT